MTEPLDLMALEPSGTHLIEASAGTGKTYTIASLFLRLLLERGMAAERILVVTYTVPATDELKTRIRARLRQARDAFAAGTSPDPFLSALVARVPDRPRALQALEQALARFDQAAISTIHGFCQRMLRELAFETGSPFETELVTDQTELVAGAAEDFYRIHVAGNPVPEFIAYCRGRGVSPEWFMDLAARPNLSARLIPPGGEPPEWGGLTGLIASYRRAFEELAAIWPGARPEVERLVSDKASIKQNILKADLVPGYLDEIGRFLGMGPLTLPSGKSLARFTPAGIEKATKKDGKVPAHPAFALCGALHDAGLALASAMEGALTRLKVRFLSSLEQDLASRKEARGLVHYDDLLLRVHRALRSRGGEDLARAVAARFDAALIDEFQDTDPLQYEIFTTCFAGSTLFFIGDPKQAVYGFRGADVFTYARAAQAVEGHARHTLVHNWRSEPGLIAAVNAVFSRAEHPFVFKWISFQDAVPADRPDRKTLTGLTDGSLVVWHLEPEDGTVVSVPRARAEVCRATAFEISRLLALSKSGEVRLGGEGLNPRDMAVLVRTNREARMVRDALRRALIPCVLYSDENVFFSGEALEMDMLLAALAEPHREALVRTALMTRIFGLDAVALDALAADEAAWEGWIERFRAWRDTWAGAGFTPMIRSLLDREGVRPRLLGCEGGERALTNVLHIAEILGRAEAADRLGMQGLRKWLAERRDPALPGNDEYQLRLESDEDAVRVMTVHKSKGLEFPIVFCPFAWSAGDRRKREGVVFHDEADRAVFDLGSGEYDIHSALAATESEAEDVRLLYVALTRAKNRCYAALTAVRNEARSAMALLLGQPGGTGIRQGLSDLVERSAGMARVKRLPREEPLSPEGSSAAGPEPAARLFTRAVDRTWGMASYTSFVRGLHRAGDAADRDMLRHAALEDVGQRKDRARDIFSFPRGARAGTLLHEVFERIDFTAGRDAIRAVAEETLAKYGFDTAWAEAVTAMVGNVLASDLGGMSLAGVTRDRRLTELEFMFPLKTLTPEGLHRALHGCLPPGSPAGMPYPTARLAFDPVKGFLRGFMDLVFVHERRYFLVDWKSNHLGDAVEDYHPDALASVMAREGYVLQYHLYCVALDQYLRNRMDGYDYDSHFGGVIYVFLRGVDPAKGSGYGIFRARSDGETVARMAAVLMDGVEE